VSVAHRRRQVPWAAVFAAIERASAAAPDWEEPHHLYAQALAWWGWSAGDLDQDVERAYHDGAWGEVLRWAAAADESQPAVWRSGRAAAREEALRRLGPPDAARIARAEADAAEARSRPVRAVHAGFEGPLELTGLDLPATARPGEPVTVRYGWRLRAGARQNYAVRVRLVAPGREFVWEHTIGAGHGTARWAPGEQVYETVTLTVPDDTPAGTYAVRLGTWELATGQTLKVGDSDLPKARRSVLAGTLTVER
jgi:hypothetical protein